MIKCVINIWVPIFFVTNLNMFNRGKLENK